MVTGADAFWIRWVLAFVSDPELVLRKLAVTGTVDGNNVQWLEKVSDEQYSAR